jgi:hypothetical protein
MITKSHLNKLSKINFIWTIILYLFCISLTIYMVFGEQEENKLTLLQGAGLIFIISIFYILYNYLCIFIKSIVWKLAGEKEDDSQ